LRFGSLPPLSSHSLWGSRHGAIFHAGCLDGGKALCGLPVDFPVECETASLTRISHHLTPGEGTRRIHEREKQLVAILPRW
jgi:hypothetical protein